jgi:signal transduction histidine kinase
MLNYQKSTDAASTAQEENEDIAAIIQELRRPMSSIIGYTNFLLSESLGILGEKQQKFLERIKISSHRLNKLIDELADLTTAPDERTLLISETIDLNEVIDDAVDQTQFQLRKKNIILRVDVPADLPQLCTDRDSLGQALTNLLENAGEVTSSEGEITLGARLQNGDIDREYMLLQISDQGGGIPPEFLPHVFSRVVYAEGSPVQGVGEKHAGLSIVKMLVENLGGRIWVDSEPGVGATYSILLPITLPASSGNGAGVRLE